MESLWKLAWAFPLVLVLGMAAILVLRRFMPPVAAAPAQDQLLLERSLSLSPDATAHLIKVDGEAMLVVIANGGVTAIPVQAANAATAVTRRASPWVRRP